MGYILVPAGNLDFIFILSVPIAKNYSFALGLLAIAHGRLLVLTTPHPIQLFTFLRRHHYSYTI